MLGDNLTGMDENSLPHSRFDSNSFCALFRVVKGLSVPPSLSKRVKNKSVSRPCGGKPSLLFETFTVFMVASEVKYMFFSLYS